MPSKRTTRKAGAKRRSGTKRQRGGLPGFLKRAIGIPKNRNKPRRSESRPWTTPLTKTERNKQNAIEAKFRKNLANYESRRQNYTFRSTNKNFNKHVKNSKRNENYKNALEKIKEGRRKRIEECVKKCKGPMNNNNNNNPFRNLNGFNAFKNN